MSFRARAWRGVDFGGAGVEWAALAEADVPFGEGGEALQKAGEGLQGQAFCVRGLGLLDLGGLAGTSDYLASISVPLPTCLAMCAGSCSGLFGVTCEWQRLEVPDPRPDLRQMFLEDARFPFVGALCHGTFDQPRKGLLVTLEFLKVRPVLIGVVLVVHLASSVSDTSPSKCVVANAEPLHERL